MKEKETNFKYHLVMNKALDLQQIDRDAKAGKRPQHLMGVLSQRLGASIHQPKTEPISPIDEFRAKIVGKPEYWVLARRLASQLNQNDIIICDGEDIGIPIAAICGAKQNRPRIAVYIHTLYGLHGVKICEMFRLAERIDLFLPHTLPLVEFLRNYLNLPASRVPLIYSQTDTNFFSPGSPSPNKQRPVIASIGLERRDYRTLAAATHDLDVDVRISGFSQDATVLAKTFPEKMPDNMIRRYYEWQELLQLYRNADLVVISLLETNHGAGCTTLLEAMACRRPVIATCTRGLAEYLKPEGIVTTVAPGDSLGMRQAIVNMLNNPQAAAAQSQRAYEVTLERYSHAQHLDFLISQVAAIEKSNCSPSSQ
ncbi:MAG TPA: glycosyl transferase [Cyanobacteria bacterium UBA8803]|nr:glycosyl transferase [Cyanobacteria bacterium UBA9273]HBL58665.1 glycosyl transferase [Cyanobacteria bacterium UBA8803]